MATLNVAAVEAYARGLGVAASSIQPRASEAVGDVADLMADLARSFAPFRSGDLHDSIRSTGSGLSRAVEATQRYASFVEYGTYKDDPQPFFGPAADIAEDALGDRVDRAAAEVLGQL